jgi:hypothetical protein
MDGSLRTAEDETLVDILLFHPSNSNPDLLSTCGHWNLLFRLSIKSSDRNLVAVWLIPVSYLFKILEMLTIIKYDWSLRI